MPKGITFMLVSLHAKNFAIIDEIEVYFGEHLNIISGETGAGKSVIIGSINAALGAKVTKDIVRAGCEQAMVELLFKTNQERVRAMLKEQEVSFEGDEILISYKITVSGKSLFRINGEVVSRAFVKELAGELIDIHGQHEHQSLLNKSKHLEMVDRFAAEELGGIKKKLRESFSRYRALQKEYSEAQTDEEMRLRELSFLQFELHAIEEANLTPGEEEELMREHKRLANANTIQETLAAVYRLSSEGEESVAEQLGYAVRQLAKIEQYDEKLADLYASLESLEGMAHDFNRELNNYMEDCEDEGEHFAQVEERLDLVNRLTTRYGTDVAGVLAYAQECREKIEKYENYDQYLEHLKKNCKKAEEELKELCMRASALRKESAKELTIQLSQALRDLNFLDVRLELHFETLENYTANGTDDVEFLISTNPGEAIRSLSRIASGGELSRIMLALKSVFSGKDEIETMIFDEIDVGVSGRTAQMVSEKMAKISKKRQLLCITHLPQIASMADTHFIIEKTTDGQRTRTEIRKLTPEGEIEEIARMLGGVQITDKVLESASEMKLLANAKKQEVFASTSEKC